MVLQNPDEPVSYPDFLIWRQSIREHVAVAKLRDRLQLAPGAVPPPSGEGVPWPSPAALDSLDVENYLSEVHALFAEPTHAASSQGDEFAVAASSFEQIRDPRGGSGPRKGAVMYLLRHHDLNKNLRKELLPWLLTVSRARM